MTRYEKLSILIAILTLIATVFSLLNKYFKYEKRTALFPEDGPFSDQLEEAD